MNIVKKIFQLFKKKESSKPLMVYCDETLPNNEVKDDEEIYFVNSKTGEEFLFDGSAESLAKFAMSSDSDFVMGEIISK